ARLGFRIRGRVWVVVVEPDDAGGTRAISAEVTRRRAARAIGDLLAETGGLVVERGTGFVLLVPGEPELAEVERLARAAIEAAGARAGGVSLSAGIGAQPGGPADLRRLAEEARQALQILQRSKRRGGVAAYARLGVERLLLEITDADRLTAYVDEWLGALLRHGESGPAAAPLLETLEALVSEGWNMRAAARRLNVHVNTLLYRLGRAEQLTGRSLDDAEARLALSVALRARALLAGLDEPSSSTPGEARTIRPYSPTGPRPTLAGLTGTLPNPA
ncbi:MAG: helix-turn-helix domain-containing protein, partial [Actinomycetota bacterium]